MALTKYREGSFRELWTISWPLMVASLSMLAMIFVDRLFLAWYSTEALNAVVNASTLGWALIFGWEMLTGIAGVFVAQYHGAGEPHKMASPVWQMIWLSLASWAFFLPMAVWGVPLICQFGPYAHLEREYLFVMMLFGPVIPFYHAVKSFWIGRGKTGLITGLAIAANILNVILDIILIFGIEGIVPSLGVRGAAIATSIGAVFQGLIFLVLFLRKKYRIKYGTGQVRFCWDMFRRCLKIGVPTAIFVVIELTGWALFYRMMTWTSEMHITIAGICQSVVILLWFFAEGLYKGGLAISGNLIGAKRHHLVPKMLKSGARLLLGFFVFIIPLCMLFPDYLAHQFLDSSEIVQIEELLGPFRVSLICIFIYIWLEAARSLIASVLTAAGDTRFHMIAGSASVWLFLLLPVYFIVVKGGASIEIAMLITVFYSVVATLIYLLRFLSGKWKQLEIMV